MKSFFQLVLTSCVFFPLASHAFDLVKEIRANNIDGVRLYLDSLSKDELIKAFEPISFFHSTPLHAAAHCGYYEIARLLLNAGIPVDDVELGGETPLDMAVVYGHYGVIELLLAAGAQADRKDKYGSTPLHSAARHKCDKVVKLLLAAGASIECRDKSGKTPVDDAENELWNDVVIDILRSAHADSELYKMQGVIPLDFVGRSACINRAYYESCGSNSKLKDDLHTILGTFLKRKSRINRLLYKLCDNFFELKLKNIRKSYDDYYYSDVYDQTNYLIKRDSKVGVCIQKSVEHQYNLVTLLEKNKLSDMQYRFD